MKYGLIFFLALKFFAPLYAQISPGDLTAAHINLEGIKNCTQCHTLGGGPDANKCLTCHREIKQYLNAKSGFHFNVFSRQNTSCFDCHSEHNGRSFQLVFWKNGRDNFNHTQTGYTLQGKHTQVKCENCHQPKNIKADLTRLNKDINLIKTYLGLSKQCASCHFDEHRRQLGSDCQSCHNFDLWRPAEKFDHNRSKYKLTGKHLNVDCKKCHVEVVTATSSPETKKRTTAKYRNLDFQKCTSCHQDVHKGKFSADCQKCHSTAGWHLINKEQFNHSLTRFPLLGKHQNVECIKCHPGNKTNVPLRFALCKDCHKDIHQGQFLRRADNGRCESCHDIFGFSPAKYGLVDHNKTDYPLTGSHLAVPCRSCHVKDRSGLQVFKFHDKSCKTCHKDVHQGQFASKISKGGCETCHQTNSWKKTKFKHDDTRFPLQGKHKQAECGKCHTTVNKGLSGEFVLYQLKSFDCASCHEDIHLGQFNERNSQADCRKCHTSNSWFELLFDHNVHSSFKITGGHIKVECSGCHQQEARNGKRYMRFKPIDQRCSACHVNKTLKEL